MWSRFRAGALAVVLATAATSRALAQDVAPFVTGPYLQDLAPTSVKLLWDTEAPLPAAVTVEGPGGRRRIEVAAARRHEVTLEGLAPASRYVYRVETGGAAVSGELATAPPAGADVPMTFVVYGDTRSQLDAHRRVAERIATEVPDFLLGTGDYVDDGAQPRQWLQFFEVERALLRDNVLFPSIGNHDRQGRGRTADAWRTYFAVPENSPDPERYYAVTYGDARVLVLDSNLHSFSLTDQTDWLEAQLQAARRDPRVEHVFVVMHHPPFSVSLHGGHRDLRERWTPLFERYGVDAVFSGHDHVYSRAEHGGVRYFVTGGGGAPLYPRSTRASALDRAVTQAFEREHHYLRVAVYGEAVEVAAIRADGTTIETVRWTSAPAPRGEVGASQALPPSPSPAPSAAVAVAAAGAAGAVPTRAATRSPPPGGSDGLRLLVVLGVALASAAAWRVSRRRARPAS